jgi:TPR repeat protein
MKTILKALRTLAKFLVVLLILLVVLVTIFLPTAMDYDHANMTKVQLHYELAKRIANTAYVIGSIREELNLVNRLPTDADSWILLFNPDGNLAPGGGNAYLADFDGDAITGAIGVASNSWESVAITRPAFEEMHAESTTITMASALQFKSTVLAVDLAEDLDIVRKKAALGNQSAQYYMGLMYDSRSEGVPLDREEAEKWYRLAADQGDIRAQSRLRHLSASKH